MVVIKVETRQIPAIAEQVERTNGGTQEAFFPYSHLSLNRREQSLRSNFGFKN